MAEERKHEIRRLRRLESLLMTWTLTGAALTVAAKETGHEKLSYYFAGAATSVVIGAGAASIKKSILEYDEAEEAKRAKENQEKYNATTNNPQSPQTDYKPNNN